MYDVDLRTCGTLSPICAAPAPFVSTGAVIVVRISFILSYASRHRAGGAVALAFLRGVCASRGRFRGLPLAGASMDCWEVDVATCTVFCIASLDSADDSSRPALAPHTAAVSLSILIRFDRRGESSNFVSLENWRAEFAGG